LADLKLKHNGLADVFELVLIQIFKLIPIK